MKIKRNSNTSIYQNEDTIDNIYIDIDEIISINNLDKDFIYSSDKSYKNLSKFYILKLVTQKEEEILSNPPYILINPLYSNIKVLKNEYIIPGLIKELAVYDKNTKILYTNGKLESFNEYASDLYKIQRLINILRNNIDKLEFYMIKNMNFIMNKINELIVEYKYSINMINNEKLSNILTDINQDINNFEFILSNRSNYIDSQTSRILTIITLMTFPLVVVGGWFGMNFSKKQMIFLNYKYGYIITLIICLIYIISCIYIFKDDIIYFY